MTIFHVLSKETGSKVYEYGAPEPVEWAGFEFASHDHVAQAAPEAPADTTAPESWWMYPGPFKDRLGVDALAIAASNHPICLAAKEMLSGRLYIDLKNPQTTALLDMLIAAVQPTASPYFPGSGPMTAQKKAVILGTPATPKEIYRG